MINAFCKTTFCIVALSIIPTAPKAQNSTISTKDSIQFAEITRQFNNTVNNEPAVADSFATAYFSKAQHLGNEDYMGRGATLISTARTMLDKKAEAETWHNKSMQYFEKSRNYLWMGYANRNFGLMYTAKYDFEKGLPYLLKSVEAFKKAQDHNMIISAYCSISNAYHDSKNYEKGKEYARLALQLAEEHKPVKKFYHWLAFNALAINYDDNKEYDKAIETHLNALPFAEERANATYNNLGNTFKKMGRSDTALFYFNRSLSKLKELPRSFNYAYSAAAIYGNLVDVYRIKKDYASANKHLDSALYYAEKSGSPEKMLDAYEYIYLLNKETGKPGAALAYLEKLNVIKDSLLNEEKTKAIINFREKYEAVEKQHIIDQQKYEIAQKNQWLWFSAIGLLLLCATGYFIHKANKARQARLLQQELFRRQEIEARALFEGEQNERIRIARDLHDGVGQMLSLVKMNLSTLDSADPALTKAISLTDKTIDEVRNVSHNLIPEELNFGIGKALNNLSEKINSMGATQMIVDIPEQSPFLQLEKQNELSVYRIVQEVVNNMIKHAGASLINLSIIPSDDHIRISVKDNGQGLAVEDIEKSTGLGWKNINARVHMLDGKMNVHSEKLSGTQIDIILPAHGTK